MVGKLQIESNPKKITMHIGDTQDVELYIGSSFNLKTDKAELSGTINKEIANTGIASISENTITGLSIGKQY